MVFQFLWKNSLWPSIVVGKDFLFRDNVRVKMLMVSEKGLEGNHRVITEISIISVVLHLRGEDFTIVDDVSYVLRIDIFGLMSFPNHFFPEV